MNLLDGLGGDASQLKGAAQKLRKGLEGVTLAIGTVTKMLLKIYICQLIKLKIIRYDFNKILHIGFVGTHNVLKKG